MSAAGLRPRAAAVLAPLNRPLTSYYLIVGTTGLLLAIGLVMVLSTSSASQLDAGGSPYSVFVHQALGAVVGVALMWVLARTPPRVFRAVAYPAFIVALASLVLVLVFGTPVAGAQRWIHIPVLGKVQPSEFAKLAFLIWGANLLARKEELGRLKDWRTLLIPLLPGAATLGLLVVLGDDLGTTFLLLVILLALLWVIGTPAKLFAGVLGLVIFALLLLIQVAKYRSGRISSFLNPTMTNNWQLIQGKYAIGSGGLFGVGLGDSRQKWGWVPNDDTDFIFAILGEELGLIGTGCVLLLYSGLAYAGLRVARRVTDPFMRLAAAGATAWIIGQAVVNICAVVGLLPITGVPLPLISQGLSSVLATMAATGMLLSFAKCEPGAREALVTLAARRRRRLPGVLRRDPVLAQAEPPPAGKADRPPGGKAAAPPGGKAAAPPGGKAERRTRPARPGHLRQSGQSRLADPGRSDTPGGSARGGADRPGGRRGRASPLGRAGGGSRAAGGPGVQAGGAPGSQGGAAGSRTDGAAGSRAGTVGPGGRQRSPAQDSALSVPRQPAAPSGSGQRKAARQAPGQRGTGSGSARPRGQ
ncbi:MAG TPA: putative lipid II flippase FtsW [Streptosporangiaceae bacterium]